MLKRIAPASLALAVLALAQGTASPVRAAAAASPSLDAGAWDLTYEKGNRRCRLFLRSEPRGDAFALAMPAVCHKAFPTLAGVTIWSAGSGERIQFRSEAGEAAIEFLPDGNGGLVARAGEGEEYLLTPINPSQQERLRTASVPPAAAASSAGAGDGVVVSRTPPAAGGRQATEPASATLPPTTPAEVAGNYAVLRQDRDTGCMVSLEPVGGGKGGAQKARLAPACRDQGIVVFDPASWKLVGGHELVLTARRGHSTALKRQDRGTWANAPARGAPLVLKRL